MSRLTPIYTTIESVKLRLAGKVQFQQDPNTVESGEIPNELLAQLICDAETEVEQDLRQRYAVPFRSKRTGVYVDLPDHSKRAIRMACDMSAVIQVLRMDFGRGSNISGDDYSSSTEKAYMTFIEKLLGHDQEGKERNHYRFSPPLEDLQLSASNSAADDGFRGTVINTDGGYSSLGQSFQLYPYLDRRRGWGIP